MIRVSLESCRTNKWIRSITKVEGVVEKILLLEDDRWTKIVMQWRSREDLP